MTQLQTNDPTVDEVRAIRHRISESCGHDPEQLVAYYMRLQEQFRDRLVENAKPAVSANQSAA